MRQRVRGSWAVLSGAILSVGLVGGAMAASQQGETDAEVDDAAQEAAEEPPAAERPADSGDGQREEGISESLDTEPVAEADRDNARNRIITNFPLERRQKALYTLIRQFLPND